MKALTLITMAALGAIMSPACATAPASQTQDSYMDTGVLPDTMVTDTTTEPDGPEPCPDPETRCDGLCVDTTSDPAHCGTCEISCSAEGENMEPTCESGICGSLCLPGYWDNDDDPGCEYECTYTAGVENCNGVDDNCDGNRDEGYSCTFGEEAWCTTTCGSTGLGICRMDCSIQPPASCTPPAEACNGLDDDCDDEVDEDWPPGTCGACVPDCGARECGLEPVCYTSCGTCDPTTEVCTAEGQCECVPSCLGRDCGPDPVCGESCGTCTGTDVCNASGRCVASCTPDCSGRVCGPDPVCSTSCGSCTLPATCSADGQCIAPCTPDCTGRTCGPDPVCFASCGTCTSPAVCDSTGNCSSCAETPCGLVPNCGCPDGQKCSLVTHGSSTLRACVAAGPGTMGSACTSDAGCAAGLICLELPSEEGGTAAACYPFCDSDSDCPGDASLCHEAFADTTDQICSLGCHLITSTGCPSGSKCALYVLTATGQPLTDCTSDLGSGGYLTMCAAESDCRSGFYCDSGAGQCIGYCSIWPTDTCIYGTGCRQFVDGMGSPVGIVFDGTSYGYCFDL